MNTVHSNVVEEVFQRFSSAEDSTGAWDDIDTQLSYLEWLSDAEVFQEAKFVVVGHLTGSVDCGSAACEDECFAKDALIACEYILDDFLQTDTMTPKHRYILCYYLAMSFLNMIKFKEL